MTRQPTDFLRARLLALYLLSLSAVYGSLLAWRPARASSPLSLAWPPLVLGAATLVGAAVHHRLAGLVDRSLLSKLRSVGGILYSGVLFLVTLGLLAGQGDAVDSGGAILRVLQAAFLLLAGFGRGYLGTLVNAFVLTVTALLAGGTGAAVSTTLHGGLLMFFLTADHAARKLTEYPVDVLPKAGPLLARGVLQGLLVSAALAAWFRFFPAAAYEPLQRSGAVPALPPGQLASLLGHLLFVVVASSIAFYLVLRLGGGSRGEPAEPPVVAIVPARRRAQKGAAPGYEEVVPSLKEWSARVVKLYVRTLEQLAKWGLRRRSFQTPREFARTLAPAGPAAELAELFGRARYGREEMTASDFEQASRICREILDHHRRRT